MFTADGDALWAGKSEISNDDKLLAQELRAKGQTDLAGLAEGSDLMRAFQFGLAAGLGKDEALKILQGLQGRLGETAVDVQEWIVEKMEDCRGDHRWKKVEALAEGMSSLPPW